MRRQGTHLYNMCNNAHLCCFGVAFLINDNQKESMLGLSSLHKVNFFYSFLQILLYFCILKNYYNELLSLPCPSDVRLFGK